MPAWDSWFCIMPPPLGPPGRSGRALSVPSSCTRHESHLVKPSQTPDTCLRFSHRVSPLIEHPVTQGIKPFTLTDELYLWPGPQNRSHPSSPATSPSNTRTSTPPRALEGHLFSRENWTHPPGSNLVGWIKTYRRSPVVYLQFGDGPSAYADANYRKLLGNAIAWVSAQEPEAKHCFARRVNGLPSIIPTPAVRATRASPLLYGPPQA